MNEIPQIMSLKIPENWYVLRNNFYNLEPVAGKDGYVLKEQKFAFNFELLVLKQLDFTSEDEEVKYKTGFIIDMGWKPEAKIDGTYKIRIYYRNYEDLRLSLDYKDRYLMQTMVNFCLTYLNQYNDAPSQGQIDGFMNDSNKTIFSDTFLDVFSLLPLKIFSPINIFVNEFRDQLPGEGDNINNQILLRLKKGYPSNKSDEFGWGIWIFNGIEVIVRLQHNQHKYWYHLQITHNEEESALFEFQHQDRYIIQAVVNLCTEVIAYADVRDIIDDFRKRVAKTVQALEQSST